MRSLHVIVCLLGPRAHEKHGEWSNAVSGYMSTECVSKKRLDSWGTLHLKTHQCYQVTGNSRLVKECTSLQNTYSSHCGFPIICQHHAANRFLVELINETLVMLEISIRTDMTTSINSTPGCTTPIPFRPVWLALGIDEQTDLRFADGQ